MLVEDTQRKQSAIACWLIEVNMYLENRVAELERILANIVRVGVVSSVSDAAGSARVVFDDRDNTVSFDLPVMQRQSLQNKDYAMVDVGEQVVCVFLPSGIEQGFILGSMYSSKEARPASSRDVRRVQFSDGTAIEYNRATHVLTASVQGNVVVTASGNITATTSGQVVVTAPNITLNGSVLINGPLSQGTGGAGGAATIQGPLTVNTGTITNAGTNVGSTHTHGGVQTGSGSTGVPS